MLDADEIITKNTLNYLDKSTRKILIRTLNFKMILMENV